MSYSPHNIRNICLLGHGGNGKTTLVESFLRMTGVIDRLGKTTDGNTVCDYDLRCYPNPNKVPFYSFQK